MEKGLAQGIRIRGHASLSSELRNDPLSSAKTISCQTDQCTTWMVL